MDDQVLSTILRLIHQDRTSLPDPPSLHERVLAIPAAHPHQHRWLPPLRSGRFQSMFSAVRFAVAGVIVALFGGFLFAGILTTQQGDEMAPAAVSAPATTEATSEPTEAPTTSVRTDLLPGVALTVEEAQPGVFRVVNDGVRDLASLDAEDIVTGYDGGIWLPQRDEFLRLGSDGSHGWPVGSGHTLEVAPDGTMWTFTCGAAPWSCREARWSTDGEEWTVEPCPGIGEGAPCQGFTVAPDGTVWMSWREEWNQWRVGHLGPTGWQPLDGYAVSDCPEGGSFSGYKLMFVTGAGDVYGLDKCDIYRLEDGGWEFFSHEPDFAYRASLVDVGPDGTVWLANDGILGRFADGGWEDWDPAALLPDTRYAPGGIDEFRVAPDGSLWFSLWQTEDGKDAVDGHVACDGLARFDGETLDRFLPGRCISSMDIAADGSVWVFAGDETVWVLDVDEWILADDNTWDLYVMTPEAVPTPEAIDTTVATTTTSDILPGVTLTVEEVEPGIFQVVSDGVRDVERVTMTAVGGDGSIWMDSARGIVELGRPGEHPGLVDGQGSLAVAEDGTLWATSSDGPDDLRSFDGETWTAQGTIPDGAASVPDPWWSAENILDLAVHPDGSVWQVGDKLLGYAVGLRHQGTDTGTTYGIGHGLPDLGWCEACVEGRWCECEEAWDVEITPDGTVWVGIPEGGLLRFEGTDWEVVRPLGGDDDHGVIGLASNGDGILWAEFETGHLARFDGGAWEVFSHHTPSSSGLSYAPVCAPVSHRIRSVDPDGNLWVGSDWDDDIASDECGGVRRFDGSTWTTFLRGMHVADIDIAEDGSAWVTLPRGAGLPWVPGYGYGGDLYVITPEAVAGAE